MQKIFNFTLFIILLSLNNISLAYYEVDKNSTFESFNTISETIIALDSTKNKIETTLRNTLNNSSQRKQSKSANKKDINEYQVFINYLSAQINDYCTIIYNKYGSDALLSLPCENKISYTNLGNDNSSLTMNEQIESLDDELMNSLGTFDEMLLKEEEIIAMQSRKSQSSSESSSGKGDNADADADGVEKSSNEKEDSDNGKSQQKKSNSDKELNDEDYSEEEKNANTSAKSKSQSRKDQRERRKLDEIDDDIVARQLKEAAEKEKDPALKKKLWDEYYKYKKKNSK